ncbi:alginate export family protein [uncultured Brevundimonas sp.]|uniref:alginate export family protein n=1 Tax=uncultured Brevundimonas sp. TaxID=213418 RepID=UPI002638A877|nr:alginate export family protein [uncultured Brevundimonas sp.]
MKPAALLAATCLAALSTPAMAQTAPAAAPSDGVVLKPSLDARLRYEAVDRDAPLTDARAATLRLRPGVEISSGAWSILAEGEATVALRDDYNDAIPTNGVEPFANVADPETIELNRLQLRYATSPLTVTVGRQRINLDDQRFVGASGWRQNEQTFDAVRAEGRLGALKLDLAYGNSQRTILGADAGPRRAWSGDFALFGASGTAGPFTVKGFAYLLDFDDPLQAMSSSDTMGVRINGAVSVPGLAPVSLTASYARQTDAGTNPSDYAADYVLVEATTAVAEFTFTATLEDLGADQGRGLQTPLATLHRFNGWADVFTTTPPEGLRDLSLTLTRPLPGVEALPGLSASLALHDFDSSGGGRAYGREWDALVSFKPGPFVVTVKYADYDADGFQADVRKAWVQLEWALQP